jgi:DNA-binding NarL/FixJ family response regulator
MIRVALLHHNETAIDGVVAWLDSHAPDIEITKIATSLPSLIADKTYPPEIVLIDYPLTDPASMPEQIRTIRGTGARVVVMTQLDDPKAVVRALAAGADSFTRRHRSMREVLLQIRRAAAQDHFSNQQQSQSQSQ